MEIRHITPSTGADTASKPNTSAIMVIRITSVTTAVITAIAATTIAVTEAESA